MPITHDATVNFGYGNVTVAPSPASSGTSITVSLPAAPAVPFNAVVWPEENRPLPSNSEIVRFTAYNSGTGVGTIARTQEGSSARSIKVGDQIIVGVTAKYFSDLWTAVEAAKTEAEAAAAAAGGTAAQILDSLQYSAELEARRSVALARAAFDEESFTEAWANLTAWELSEAESVKVNAGTVVGTAKTIPAAIHSFTAANGKFRLVASINFVSGGTAGKNIGIGVASGAGKAETATWTLIGMDLSTGAWRAFYENSWHNLGTTAHATGTYLVTITGDETGVSFTINKSDREVSKEEAMLRTRVQVGSVAAAVVFDADVRGNTGATIGPLAHKKAIGTATVRTGVEGIGVSRVHWTEKSAGVTPMRIETPASLDTRIPPKGWIFFEHGLLDQPEAAQEFTPIEDAARAPMFKALVEAGFAIVSPRSTNAAGNEASQTDLLNAYEYVRDNYPIAPVLMMGFSAGGAAAAIATVRRKIPVAALVLISGLINLNYVKETHSPSALETALEAAYGLEASWANYATVITAKGLDPCAHPAVDYRGIPVGIFASPEDTAAPKANHADVLAAKLEAAGGSQRILTRVSTTGAHASAGNFPTTSMVNFCNSAVIL